MHGQLKKKNPSPLHLCCCIDKICISRKAVRVWHWEEMFQTRSWSWISSLKTDVCSVEDIEPFCVCELFIPSFFVFFSDWTTSRVNSMAVLWSSSFVCLLPSIRDYSFVVFRLLCWRASNNVRMMFLENVDFVSSVLLTLYNVHSLLLYILHVKCYSFYVGTKTQLLFASNVQKTWQSCKTTHKLGVCKIAWRFWCFTVNLFSWCGCL